MEDIMHDIGTEPTIVLDRIDVESNTVFDPDKVYWGFTFGENDDGTICTSIPLPTVHIDEGGHLPDVDPWGYIINVGFIGRFDTAVLTEVEKFNVRRTGPIETVTLVGNTLHRGFDMVFDDVDVEV